ncbi:hypothetical protein K1T71_013881 [Dendrolimus kikuchii]|uniref:Uncharacterized protein n=1 Tax=Dendrolimus kikuchii TaxID=765133 RepID=A0ACC1CFX6_9NEOP|nr:hypothetical protein K1T71_013881 [Dendrolimus kikuchii]
MEGANADSDHSMTWEDFFGLYTFRNLLQRSQVLKYEYKYATIVHCPQRRKSTLLLIVHEASITTVQTSAVHVRLWSSQSGASRVDTIRSPPSYTFVNASATQPNF